MVSDLHNVVNAVTVCFPDVLILLLGDFNYPNITLPSSGPSLCTFSTEFYDFLKFCSDFNFTQVVPQPTRITSSSATVLDLVLTTSSKLVCRSSVQVKWIVDYARADFGAMNYQLSIFLRDYLHGFSERSVEAN